MKCVYAVWCLLIGILVSGCSTVLLEPVLYPGDVPAFPDERESPPVETSVVGYSYPEVIPAGHLPPPGHCRIWIPGVPPGHQGPPGKCETLSYQVPLGGWLISRAPGQDKQALVTFYDAQQPATIAGQAWYDAQTGHFMAVK